MPPVLSSLTEAWRGPSSSAMIQAVGPYLTWLRTTAQQCQQLGSSAQVAAAAFGSTLSAVVHPAAVSANRIQLAQLLATNGFGRNLATIAETEAQYESMWVNTSAAMYRYEAASAQALVLPQFSSPPSIANVTGPAAQASAVPAAAAAAAPAAAVSPLDSVLQALGVNFDPQAGWFGLANTYANQFISSGFPVNLLSYAAQNTSAQALQAVAPEIGQGLSEGESALGASAAQFVQRGHSPWRGTSTNGSGRRWSFDGQPHRATCCGGAVDRFTNAGATCVGGVAASSGGVRVPHAPAADAAADLGRQWLAQEEAAKVRRYCNGLGAQGDGDAPTPSGG